jgi:hypothetical protein
MSQVFAWDIFFGLFIVNSNPGQQICVVKMRGLGSVEEKLSQECIPRKLLRKRPQAAIPVGPPSISSVKDFFGSLLLYCGHV